MKLVLKNDNNLFFLCSLIEFIGRQQRQKRETVVLALGEKHYAVFINMQMIYIVSLLKKQRMSLFLLVTFRLGVLIMRRNASMMFPTIGR